MRKVKLTSAKTISVYEDIEELPIKNYNQAQEYSFMSANAGCSQEDVLTHYQRIGMFCMQGKFDEAMQQRKNLQQGMWNYLRGIDYDFLELICYSDQPAKEENAYELLSIDLEAWTKHANNLMQDFNQVMTPLTKAISKKQSTNITGLILQTLGKIEPLENRRKSISFSHQELLEGLKKKSTLN